MPKSPLTTDEPLRIDGRTDHKAETRGALIEAALWLFATKGYDATSTDEIAELAGVSPRTFFRYFETKDRVLLFGGESFNRAVVRELPNQDPSLTDFDALAATVRSIAPALAPPKARLRLYFRALETSTVLLGQHTRATAEHNASVALALASRRGLRNPDDRCRLAGQLATVAMERAYRIWIGSKRDLTDTMDESFELLRSVAGPPRMARRSR